MEFCIKKAIVMQIPCEVNYKFGKIQIGNILKMFDL